MISSTPDDYLERDYQRVVQGTGPTRFLPGTSIEIVHEARRDLPPEHVLFDFDGTLSLIREGWPEVMVPMMVEMLQQTGTDESPQQLYRLAHDFVMELNGKQTIYQMIRLAEEIRKRGGTPREPLEYKQIYHDRLMERIRSRREALQTGRVPPEDMLVPGALDLLRRLRDLGVRVYLASGTDERYVWEEVRLLGLDRWFGEHVYGAIDDYKSFSKAKVIERILEKNRVQGDRLLGFGDGYVEIQNIKAVGGLAVAVASDEANRSGKPDLWKRDRLIGVGADLVIPDFRECEALLAWLWGEGRPGR
jgi:phosphoglycolate phosphatase